MLGQANHHLQQLPQQLSQCSLHNQGLETHCFFSVFPCRVEILFGEQRGFLTLLFSPIPFCSLWQIGQNLNRNFYKTRSNPVSEFISFCPVICSVPPTHAHIAQAPKEMFSSARALLSRVSAGAHRLRIFLSAHSLPGSLGPAAGSRCLNCCLLSKANLLCGYEIWGRKWHQRCFNNFPKSNKSACGLSLEFIE